MQKFKFLKIQVRLTLTHLLIFIGVFAAFDGFKVAKEAVLDAAENASMAMIVGAFVLGAYYFSLSRKSTQYKYRPRISFSFIAVSFILLSIIKVLTDQIMTGIFLGQVSGGMIAIIFNFEWSPLPDPITGEKLIIVPKKYALKSIAIQMLTFLAIVGTIIYMLY